MTTKRLKYITLNTILFHKSVHYFICRYKQPNLYVKVGHITYRFKMTDEKQDFEGSLLRDVQRPYTFGHTSFSNCNPLFLS